LQPLPGLLPQGPEVKHITYSYLQQEQIMIPDRDDQKRAFGKRLAFQIREIRTPSPEKETFPIYPLHGQFRGACRELSGR